MNDFGAGKEAEDLQKARAERKKMLQTMEKELKQENKQKRLKNPIRENLLAKKDTHMALLLKKMYPKKLLADIALPDDFKYESYPLFVNNKYYLVNFKTDPIFSLTEPSAHRQLN